MSGTTMTGDDRVPRGGVLLRAGERLAVGPRALLLSLLAFGGGCALLAAPFALLPGFFYIGVGFGGGRTGPHTALFVAITAVLLVFAIPATLLGPRLAAWLSRQLIGRWCGVTIPSPYRPYAEHRANARRPLRGRLGWLLTDPATWRDMVWTALASGAVLLVAAVPADLVRSGVDSLIGFHPVSQDMFVPELRATAPLANRVDWWMNSRFQLGCLTLLLSTTVLGLLFGPRLLTAYGAFSRVLLGPTKQVELARRIRHLAETRSDTIDSGAAVVRRIERDLHDGAQARLVATGMALGAVEALLDSDPAAARALLAEAKESSAKALAELRDLVRGIHPPVLADRGLVEAIRALALDLPLRVHFAGDLPGRPSPPVESAAFFAASELLANVVKHASARQAWIDVRHTDGTLRIGVTDDGRGGADPAGGSGLHGVERRLAAFDGVLAVSSPLGGPTVANLEIPCVLSWPKTSTS